MKIPHQAGEEFFMLTNNSIADNIYPNLNSDTPIIPIDFFLLPTNPFTDESRRDGKQGEPPCFRKLRPNSRM
jgi:hypothetical protein